MNNRSLRLSTAALAAALAAYFVVVALCDAGDAPRPPPDATPAPRQSLDLAANEPSTRDTPIQRRAFSETRRVVVAVVDEQSSPVAEAGVFLEGGEGPVCIGTTKPDGRLAVEVAKESLKLTVRHADYCPQVVDEVSVGTEAVVVVLKRGCRTAGKVIRSDGGSPDGLVVCSWRTGAMPSERLLSRVLVDPSAVRGSAEVRAAVVADGRFELPAGPCQETTTVAVFGRGWVSIRPIVRNDPADREVELRAVPVYAIAIQLESTGSAPLRATPGTVSQGFGFPEDMSPLDDRDPLIRAASGMNPNDWTAKKHRQLWLLTCPFVGPKSGEVEFGCSSLGYEPVSATLQASHCAIEVQVSTIAMTELAPSGWGSLRVEFPTSVDMPDSGSSYRFEISVVNHDVGRSLTWCVGRERSKTAQLPVGNYTVSVTPCHRQIVAVPPSSVRIEADKESVVSVAAGDTGGVHWKVGGSHASGRPIVINMHRVRPDGKRVSLCSLQEYESEGCFEFLPVGVYAFDWVGSRAEYDAMTPREAVVVEIKSGQIAELVLADT